VPAGDDHARERAFAVGEVEISGHMMIGPAFVNDPFDDIAVALVGADRFAVERRLLRKAAKGFDEFRLQLGLAFLDVLRGLECPYGLAASVEVYLCLSNQIFMQHLARRDAVGVGFQDG
jgi:hypothetical protein